MNELLGKKIVVDTDSPYVYLGIFDRLSEDALILTEADVHDKNDIDITKEKYILDSRRYGIKENRKNVYVMRSRIVSVSALEDVIRF